MTLLSAVTIGALNVVVFTDVSVEPDASGVPVAEGTFTVHTAGAASPASAVVSAVTVIVTSSVSDHAVVCDSLAPYDVSVNCNYWCIERSSHWCLL